MIKRKGFTLIELIVVIAIIGVLIGISIGAYKGYTKEARLTEYKNNIKVLEGASEQYYIKHGTWPRLGEPENYFSSEQLVTYSERILDITGEYPELDPEGKYYELDYVVLGKYTQIPKEKGNYIIQNPVGRVIYLENINEVGEDKLSNYIPPENSGVTPEDTQEPEQPEQPILFKGLGPGAFDKDNTTSGGIGTVTWEGDLSNKGLKVDIMGQGWSNAQFKIYGANNEALNFINLTDNNEINTINTVDGNKIVKDIIVPDGAVKFVITGYGNVYGITLMESLDQPNNINNIQSQSSNNSIILTWENTSENYEKAVIYRNGKFHKIVVGKTYTDTPLYSDSQYTYELRAVNSYGNGSVGLATHIARTTKPEIKFSGLGPGAFDKDNTTSGGIGTVTWEGDLSNKKIKVDMMGQGWSNAQFKIYGVNNEVLNFINLTDNKETNNITTVDGNRIVKDIIVPDGAVKFVITGYGNVYGITLMGSLDQPNNITNIQSQSSDNSITLTWENTSENYEKAVIYKDGVFHKIVVGKAYTDTPLYSDSQHTYELRALNSYGNGSAGLVNHTARTTKPVIIFRGLNPGAFDNDNITSGGIGTVTWEGDLSNKKIKVDMMGQGWSNAQFKIYGANNEVLNFINLTNNNEINTINTVDGNRIVKDIVVPNGAVKFVITGYGNVYGITLIN